AVGDRNRHLGDVAHLSGQIAGHGVDTVGQIFPCAGDAGDHSLAAKFPVGPDLASDTGHFSSKRVELIAHRGRGVFELENLAFDVHGNFFRQVAIGDGDGDLSDVTHLSGQVAGHHVDAFSEILPNTAHIAHLCLAAELAFGADFAGDAGDFSSKRVELIDHRVHRFFELEDFTANIDGDFFRQVAVSDGD